MLLLRVVVHAENEHTGARRRADYIVDDSRSFQEVLQRIPGRQPRSPAFPAERSDRACPAWLRACRARWPRSPARTRSWCRPRMTSPSSGSDPIVAQTRLRGGRPVGVVQPFDIAAQDRPHADAPHEPVQIHGDAGLIAVRVRDDDAGPSRHNRCRIGPIVLSTSAFISTTCLPCEWLPG